MGSLRQECLARGATVGWFGFTGPGPYVDEVADLVWTNSGSPVLVDGPIPGRSALRFPTVNDFASVPDNPAIDPTNGTLVIVSRRDLDTGVVQAFVSKGDGGLFLGFGDATDKFDLGRSGTGPLVREAATSVVGNWTTYGGSTTGTAGAGNQKLYKDAADVSFDPGFGVIAWVATSNALSIGRYHDGTLPCAGSIAALVYFAGIVLTPADHLAIWRSLGTAETVSGPTIVYLRAGEPNPSDVKLWDPTATPAAIPGGATLTDWVFTSATEGRKVGRGSVETSQTFAVEAAGRKIGRGAVLTDWALTSAVTGRKIGRGSVATSWAHSPVTTSRKIGRGSVASSIAFAPVTTGRKIGRGAVLTSWVFASVVASAAVAGIPRGTTLTSLAFTSASTGRKIGRGAVITSQALMSVVVSRAGARAGTSVISWALTSTTTGRKLSGGAIQTGWTFSPATEGRKRGRGAVVTSQALTSAVASVIPLPSDVRGTVGASAAVVGGVGASARPREAVGAGTAVVGSAGRASGVVGGVGGSATVRDTVGSGVE